MQPLKIAFVTKHYWPSRGGVETHVGAVSKLLTQAGHQVSIFTLAHPQRTKKIGPNGGEIIELNTESELKNHLPLLESQDLIHVHDVTHWVLSLKLDRSKLFQTNHGWEGRYPVPVKAKLRRWYNNWQTAGTLHIGHWIQEFYWDKPDQVSYGGVWSWEFAGRVTVPKNEHLKIVFLGRLEAENCMEQTLRFLENLQPDSVTWVGDGQYRPQAEKMGRVTGMVDQKQLQKHLTQADLVITSSYLSIWQAAAAGKLVLAFANHPLKQRYLETHPLSEFMVLNPSPEQLESLLSDRTKLKNRLTDQLTTVKKNTWNEVVATYGRLWGRDV